MDRQELKALISETVKETLTALGADVNNPRAMQQDLAALREWRVAMSSVRKKAMLTVVGTLITGLGIAIWMGVRSYFK